MVGPGSCRGASADWYLSIAQTASASPFFSENPFYTSLVLPVIHFPQVQNSLVIAIHFLFMSASSGCSLLTFFSYRHWHTTGPTKSLLAPSSDLPHQLFSVLPSTKYSSESRRAGELHRGHIPTIWRIHLTAHHRIRGTEPFLNSTLYDFVLIPLTGAGFFSTVPRVTIYSIVSRDTNCAHFGRTTASRRIPWMYPNAAFFVISSVVF